MENKVLKKEELYRGRELKNINWSISREQWFEDSNTKILRTNSVNHYTDKTFDAQLVKKKKKVISPIMSKYDFPTLQKYKSKKYTQEMAWIARFRTGKQVVRT